MIGLEIKINGEVIAVVGGNEVDFLTTWVEAVGNFSSKEEFQCWLTATGKTVSKDDDSYDWQEWFRQHKINVNDEVSFKFIETNSITQPLQKKTKKNMKPEEVKTKVSEAIKKLKNEGQSS